MSSTPSITRTLGAQLWHESDLELIIRWWGRQTDALKAEIESPEAALERARTRAQRVLDFCQLPAAKPMKTPRQWQVGFDPAAAWERLCVPLRHWGWDIARQRDEPTFTNITRTALEHADKPLVVVADAPLKIKLSLAQATKCPFELDLPHLAAMALALELYSVASERMGALPKPWVDEVAAPAFAQLVLGMPFSPMIFALFPK
jgi:hypothetical protein